MNLEIIRPRADGKYSPLLHKWLSSARFKRARQVYQAGSILDRSEHNERWRSGEIIIGENYKDGFVGGRNLSDIICGRRGVKSMGYAYSVAGFNLREITDEFWTEYVLIGRCAWDHDHGMPMIGDEGRWHYIAGGRQRECQWCGRVFEAETTTTVEVKTRKFWREYLNYEPSTLLHPMGSMGEAA